MWLWCAPLYATALHITEEFIWPGGFGDRGRAYRPAMRQSITPGLVTGVLLYGPLAGFGIWRFVDAGQLSALAALGWGAAGASSHLWSSIGHPIRARGRPTSP